MDINYKGLFQCPSCGKTANQAGSWEYENPFIKNKLETGVSFNHSDSWLEGSFCFLRLSFQENK